MLLPLVHGYTLEQTAQMVGRSCGETSRLRNAFIATQEGRLVARPSASHRRAEQHQRQGAALDELLPLAAEGGVVVIPQLKPLLEQKLGRSLCLASVYNLLHRHGWRKLAPDTVHPKGDPSAREAWKKTSKIVGRNQQPIRRKSSRTPPVSGRGPFWAHQSMSALLAIVKAMLTYEYTYAYGAVSPLDGRFDSLILPTVNTQCMQIFIDEIAQRYANENNIMIMDGAGWHRSGSLRLPENMKLFFYRRTHRNATRKNIFGKSCVKNSFITSRLKAWKRSKMILKKASYPSKTTQN